MTQKIIWVKWRDSCIFVNEYHDPAVEANHHPVAVFESVGFLIHSDADRLTLAMDWDGSDERYRQIMSIPTENVVKKRMIKL